MNEPIWKLQPMRQGQTEQVVWRRWDDGTQESCLVTAVEYLKWVSEGNVAQPADEV